MGYVGDGVRVSCSFIGILCTRVLLSPAVLCCGHDQCGMLHVACIRGWVANAGS
jgi:hypothetical protein